MIDNYERARGITRASTSDAARRIADELLVREVLDADQVRRIVAGQPCDAPEPLQSPARRRREVVSRGARAPPIVPPMPHPEQATRAGIDQPSAEVGVGTKSEILNRASRRLFIR